MTIETTDDVVEWRVNADGVKNGHRGVVSIEVHRDRIVILATAPVKEGEERPTENATLTLMRNGPMPERLVTNIQNAVRAIATMAAGLLGDYESEIRRVPIDDTEAEDVPVTPGTLLGSN